jgi:hypothetical protein
MSNETKWTPGPWAVRHKKSIGRPIIQVGNPETGFFVCKCDTMEDAHLIAAAPELLEALETLLRVDDEWHASINSEMALARYAARVALRKAKGEA